MTVFAAIMLLINAVFNLVVWPRFFKRIADDPRATDENGKRTTFFTVHAVLISIAIVIATFSLAAGVALLVG